MRIPHAPRAPRARTALGLLISCCAGLAACMAGAPEGPNTTVSTPSVGRPQPPSSAQAALSRDAFTPYAALGQSNDDGLAPHESSNALADACMTAAGYPNSGNLPFSVEFGPAELAFSPPWGSWGYLGTAEAEQYGFRLPPGSVVSALGIDAPPPNSPGTIPAAEQTAFDTCGALVQSFTNAVQNGSLAGIGTLTSVIYNDVLHDVAVNKALQAWSECMARNGYDYHNPQDVFFKETQNINGGKDQISAGETVSAAASQAQIAAAVTDANCTQSADLAGIYFAVLASYEQQLVNASQQALTAAVQQYRAAYARELAKLPALLRTAKVQPFGRPRRVAP